MKEIFFLGGRMEKNSERKERREENRIKKGKKKRKLISET
jgi:hypothetical protein